MNGRRARLIAITVVAAGALVAAGAAISRWHHRAVAADFIRLALALVNPDLEGGPRAAGVATIHPALLSRSELGTYFAARAVDLDPRLEPQAHYVLGLVHLSTDCPLAKEHLKQALESPDPDEQVQEALDAIEQKGCDQLTEGGTG